MAGTVFRTVRRLLARRSSDIADSTSKRRTTPDLNEHLHPAGPLGKRSPPARHFLLSRARFHPPLPDVSSKRKTTSMTRPRRNPDGQRFRLVEDEAAADACAEFGIETDVHAISAHRNPQGVARYARDAAERGLRRDHRRCRPRRPPARRGRQHDPAAGHRRADLRRRPAGPGRPARPSSRCLPACPSPRSPSMAPATPACSPSRSSPPPIPACAGTFADYKAALVTQSQAKDKALQKRIAEL